MAVTVESTSLKDLLRSVHGLPTIPETLVRVLTLLDRPDSQAGELADVIQVDPPLSVRILRLANSPYYDAGGEITDISECIKLLGFSTVREVSLCVMLADTLLQACRDRKTSVDYRSIWRHSVYTAVLSQSLGLQLGDPAPAELFTAGLLHDLGIFIEVLHSPVEFAGIVSAKETTGHQLLEMEKTVFGCDHARIGAAFAEKWYFPQPVANVIGLHHETDIDSLPRGRDGKAVLIVSLANSVAHDLFMDDADFFRVTDEGRSDELAVALGLSEDYFDAIIAMMPELEDKASWLAG